MSGQAEAVLALQQTAGNQAVSGLVSSGEALDAPTRAYMEERFSADFSGVRIHNDRAAWRMADANQARAYVQGASVFFGAGQYTPQTREGRQLLAHELAHVVQQTSRKRVRVSPGLAAEAEAQQAGTQVMLGRPAAVLSSVTPGIQRSEAPPAEVRKKAVAEEAGGDR